MRPTLIVSVLAALITFAGCNSAPEPPAPPVTDAQLNALRADYRKQDPMARVGVVTATLESANLASVGKVNTKDFAVGDIITFIDSNGKVLVLGKVEAIHTDSIVVKYETPDKKSRAPVPGDVAARFIR